MKKKSFRQYCRQFLSDESGVEFLELAIGVAASVGVIAVIITMYSAIKNKIDSASTAVKDINTDLE